MDVNDGVAPVAEMRSHEAIDLGQELFSDHGGADQREQSTSHVPVGGAMDGCNVAFPQNVEHRLRVTRDEPFRLVHQDVSVYLRIHRHNCRAAQYVGLEEAPVPVWIQIG